MCHLQGWDYACRAADIKHLSAGSLPGTPVGRAVVLQKNWITKWSKKGKGLITQALGVISFEDKIINKFLRILSEHLY